MESNLLFQKPIHLLQPTDDRSKLMLNPDALNALKSITGPVVLVAIVGESVLVLSVLVLISRQPAWGQVDVAQPDALSPDLWFWPGALVRCADDWFLGVGAQTPTQPGADRYPNGHRGP